ncbi:MAG: hypothetical protein QM754_16255 [Tepidisphaeraceae bacterium]
MSFPEDQIVELKALYPGLTRFAEAGTTYLLLPAAKLPDGCSPERTDLLLCPTARDGYPSRLFFAERVECGKSLNWNGNARIVERNWQAYSWKVNRNDLRLAQLVTSHLRALQ